MKILLIFTLCLISDGGVSKKVTGYSGGGVLIKCKYDSGYTENQKYFCKGLWPGCVEQIKTGDKNVWINSGRFSLYDDTRSSEFSVMIRDLGVRDTGTYHCAVDIDLWMHIHTPVELKVKKGFVGTREVIGYVGTRSNIKCSYEDEYKEKKKSFCKMGTDQWCSKQISTEQNSEWSHDGKFSIHDNRSAGFFSVFIREWFMEDSGTYACAVVLPDETEIYTLVKLNVTEDLSYEKAVSETVHVGGDLTINCKYPKFLRSHPKFLCKRPKLAACLYNASVSESKKYVKEGKFTLYDDREKQIFTANIRHVSEQDSEEYWCGAEVNWKSDHGYKVYFTQIHLTVSGFPVFTMITVCLSLLVLLIGISLLTVILRKRWRSPETMTPTFRATNRDYENNLDVLSLQSRQAVSAYQCLDHNSIQSDSVYQSLMY